MEWLGYMVKLTFFKRNFQTVIQSSCTVLHFHSSNESSSFSTSSQKVVTVFFIPVILIGIGWVSLRSFFIKVTGWHCLIGSYRVLTVFRLHFPNDWWFWVSLHVLIRHSYIFFGKMPIQIFFFFRVFIFFYCCSPFSPHHSPAPCPPPPPTLNPTPLLALSVGPLYVYLDDPSPSFPYNPSPPFPPSVFFFISTSSYILLACLFCWLGSTYRWDHTIFVFNHLAYFT